MVINESLLNYFFNRKQIAKFLIVIILAVGSIVLMLLFSKMYVIENNIILNTEILKQTEIESGHEQEKWLKIKCDAIKCDYIIDKNLDVYKINKTNGALELYNEYDVENIRNEHQFQDYLKNNFNIKVKYNDEEHGNVIFIVDNNHQLDLILDVIDYIFIILIFVFTLLYFKTQYINYKNEIYEKGSYKLYAENKVQTNITEMINHELTAPVSILKVVSHELREIIYQNSIDNISSEKEDLINSFDFAITRIESILSLLSIEKKIKAGNNSVGVGDEIFISELIDNIMTSINNLHVVNIDYTIVNKDVLEKLKLNNLKIGDFLNILHVLVTNAAEAGATSIEFSAYKIHGDKINLFVKDNGSGIKNSSGEIMKSDKIFEYGYSSKNKEGEHVINKKWYIRLLSRLGISVIKTNTDRGIGLYVNKTIMENCGGKLELYDTSSRGTIFKLIIPVK